MASSRDPRLYAAFDQATANLRDALDATSDSIVAMNRVFARLQREAEESLTTEQRLAYYTLRDQGVEPFTAIQQISKWDAGDAVNREFSDWDAGKA